MDPTRSLYDTAHKVVPEHGNSSADANSNTQTSGHVPAVATPPPPYTSRGYPYLTMNPAGYHSFTVSDDEEDQYTDEEPHGIHINASTTVTGAGNVVQTEASALGARIAAHLITLLRQPSQESATYTPQDPVQPIRRTSTHESLQSTEGIPRPETLQSNGNQRAAQADTLSSPLNSCDAKVSRSRPIRITVDCSTRVGGTRNVLGGLGMRVRTGPFPPTDSAANVATGIASAGTAPEQPVEPQANSASGVKRSAENTQDAQRGKRSRSV